MEGKEQNVSQPISCTVGMYKKNRLELSAEVICLAAATKDDLMLSKKTFWVISAF